MTEVRVVGLSGKRSGNADPFPGPDLNFAICEISWVAVVFVVVLRIVTQHWR